MPIWEPEFPCFDDSDLGCRDEHHFHLGRPLRSCVFSLFGCNRVMFRHIFQRVLSVILNYSKKLPNYPKELHWPLSALVRHGKN